MNVIGDNYNEILNDTNNIIFEKKKSLRGMKCIKTNETWIYYYFFYIEYVTIFI